MILLYGLLNTEQREERKRKRVRVSGPRIRFWTAVPGSPGTAVYRVPEYECEYVSLLSAQNQLGQFPSKLLRKLQGWKGLGSSWESLGDSRKGLGASWEGLRASW